MRSLATLKNSIWGILQQVIVCILSLFSRNPDRPYRVAVLTNNFHIYRARRLADYVGFVNPAAISAKTPATQFYQNLIREICAVVYAHFRYR